MSAVLPSILSRDDPTLVLLIENRILDARVELNVTVQIETTGNVLEIFQDVGLAGYFSGHFHSC